MNVVFVNIDSLNRHFLKAYGQPIELDVQTPNLDAFARKAAVFDTHYAGSLPCMPARREFWTGVQEFLWRPWGPIEPFDRPLPRLARESEAIAQLVTDHYHFFQHGSHGYYEDFHGYEFIRGHEADAWKTWPRMPDPVGLAQIRLTGAEAQTLTRYTPRESYVRNVHEFRHERDFFAPKVFAAAAEWVEHNHDHEKWCLFIDSFDVHEPFHVPEPYASMYTDEDPKDPDMPHWPYYGRITDGPSKLSERQLAYVRAQFAGKLTMVDRWLGRLLERIDDFNLWDQTVVIITTDHGHYLGEHNWMGKPDCPLYNVLAHTPLMIWHPQGAHNGGRISALTSTVDLYATMADALGAPVSERTHSKSLTPLLTGRADRHRDWALYGYWGRAVNVTDGRYTYLHQPPSEENSPLYCYSTGMMNSAAWFHPVRIPEGLEAGRWLPYADTPLWRWPAKATPPHRESLLFNVEKDPWQKQNLTEAEPQERERMRVLLRRAMTELQAPDEQFRRLGL